MPITTGHAEAAPGLKLCCARAQAVFPEAGVCLGCEAPAAMLWDEHGGTYVLRVEDLRVLAAPDPEAPAGIYLEVALPPLEAMAAGVEAFAGRHRLALAPGPPAPEMAIRPILAACHIPGKNLFVYCEKTELQVQAGSGQTLKLTVTGAFQARHLPCREVDVVIHLTAADMARLLACLLSLARA